MRPASLLVLAAVVALGGSAEIRWLEKDHDFGLMHEQAGPVRASSRFVNLGPDAVTIFQVRPSCGCTSAEFSDEPLAVGDTATIYYTYDPTGRPGRFDKTVKVVLSGGTRHSIRITGNVLGTPESLTILYPVEAGEMRLTQPALQAGRVVMGASPVQFISAYSLPLDTMTASLTSPTAAVMITPGSVKTGPGDMATFSVVFDSRKHGQYGPVEIPLEFGDGASGGVTVPLRAFVVPDTRALVARNGGKAPRMRIVYDPVPTELHGKDRYKGELTIVNDGDAPLHILSVSMAEKPLSVKLPKEIKPGKTAHVALELEAGNLPPAPGRVQVDIVTDDPDRPVATTAIAIPL